MSRKEQAAVMMMNALKAELDSREARLSEAERGKIENSLTEIVMQAEGRLQAQVSKADTLFLSCRNYLVSNYRQLLSELYVENGLVQTIVDVPVDDALRGGVDIKTKQLDADEIEELHAEMEAENDTAVLAQGLKWNRLYGGGGLLIITGQDATTELDIDAIDPDEPLSFRAVDMWELYDPAFSEAEERSAQFKQILPIQDHFVFYGQRIHKSRVLTMKGKVPPSFIRARLRGWGFSVVEALVRSINQYLKSNNIAFEVLDEFKLDIFRIDGFNQSLITPDGTAKILKRVALANQQKNYQDALTMDIKDEYIQKQLSFAGVADIMKEIRMQVASDMRMPMTKLFGISAAGFNSGEDDIEVYNSMVESEVRSKARHPHLELIKIRAKKKFGFVPDDMTLVYRPMRVLTAEQEETVKTNKLNRVVIAFDKGLCSGKEAAEAINRDNLLPVQVEITDDLELNSGRNKSESNPFESDSGEDSEADEE